MIFTGIHNQTVEFRIANYEFPEISDCEYDSNWLLIFLNVKSECGSWQTVDPSLLTTDVKKIIQWFERLSENRISESLDFLEPNISFELLRSENIKKRIRIIFDLNSRPKRAKDEKMYFVDCELSQNELKKIATDLKKELKLFPERAI